MSRRFGGRVDLRTFLPLTDGVVSIRPLSHADAEPYATGSKDPAVREFGHLPLEEYTPELVREQIDTVITDGLRQGTVAVMAIADGDDDRFFGSAVLFDIQGDAAELGYWLAPAARGRGLARRSVELLAGFASALGVTRLTARTEVENEASRRVLQAAGFELYEEGVRQEAPSGRILQAAVYVRHSDGSTASSTSGSG